ncbi:MAG TPA: preQ(1) synthase [Victivallales bacterium]|nr:preQ(1) synthase [Victivallales bacterium]
MSRKRINGITMLGRSGVVSAKSPDEAKLETFKNRYSDRDYEISFKCPEFTSLCPVTGQPDFGEITITYVPDMSCLESKSLKLFINSFRNHNTFHEEAVNKIRDKIVEVLMPRRLEVLGVFKARGGIAITVKADYQGR